MLVQTNGKNAKYFTQHDHGIHTGEIAYNWNASMSMQAMLANTLHDFAWANIDDPARNEPPLCPETGKLYDFTTLPAQMKMPLYNKGLDQLERIHPYVGLLISVHYSAFFPRNAQSTEYHAIEDARRARIRAAQNIDEAQLKADYEWLKFFDVVSLYSCLSQPGADPENTPFWLKNTYRIEGRQYAFLWLDENTLTIDPFDAKTPIISTIPFRSLPTSFEDANAFKTAWLNAPVERWELVIKAA